MLTTVVGSYPIPDWLKTAPTPDALRDAVTVAMQAQAVAGIELISDGEVGRWDAARNAPGGMVERFVDRMEGIRRDLTRTQLEQFRSRAGMAYRERPAGIVTGPLGEGRLNLLEEWRDARAQAPRPLKFTLTSPYMLARVIANEHYANWHGLLEAFAELLAEQMRGLEADVLQIDEPNLPGNPEDGAAAAASINRIFQASPAKRKAVHLCFGNYGGQMIQRGDYGRLIDFMNRLECDHLVLETTRRSEEEVQRLGEVDRRIELGLGVIDVKDLQIESPEQVARHIEQLAGTLGAERIAFVHPDCGLRNLPRSVANGKLCNLRLGRDLFMGRRAK